MAKLPLVGQAFPARSAAVSAQASVNVFASLIEDPNERSKNKAVLYGTPGRHQYRASSGSAVRCLWSGGGRCFSIVGTSYFEMNAAGAVVGAAHTVASDSNPAQIFSNGNQLLVVSGGLAYCDNGVGPVAITTGDYAGTVNAFGTGVGWVSGDKFLSDGTWVGKTITINGAPYVVSATPDPPTPLQLYTTVPVVGTSPPSFAYAATGAPMTAVTGGVMDSTFFVQRPPGGTPDLGRQVNFSAVLDGTSWNGLDFFSKEGYPDHLKSILVDNEQIYLWGDETFEVWSANAGASLTTFYVRVSGAGGRYGCISPWGQLGLDGRVYFLGGDDRGQVSAYVLDGFTPKRISTHAEESAWNAAGLGANAVAYGYLEEGHSFYVVNFGAQAWAFDPESGAWHTRAQWSGSAFTPYGTAFHTFIPEWGTGGKHITGGADGAIYESSVNFYDDAGANIKWQRALPYVYAGGLFQYFGRLELEMETGTATTGGEPVVTYDYSDDRGGTYVNPRDAGIGVAGATSRRVWWLRNGKSRGRVIRFSGIGKSKVALIDCNCDIVVGTS